MQKGIFISSTGDGISTCIERFNEVIEKNSDINVFSGTGVGSLICTLYCLSYRSDFIMNEFTTPKNIIYTLRPFMKLIEQSNFKEKIEAYVGKFFDNSKLFNRQTTFSELFEKTKFKLFFPVYHIDFGFQCLGLGEFRNLSIYGSLIIALSTTSIYTCDDYHPIDILNPFPVHLLPKDVFFYKIYIDVVFNENAEITTMVDKFEIDVSHEIENVNSYRVQELKNIYPDIIIVMANSIRTN